MPHWAGRSVCSGLGFPLGSGGVGLGASRRGRAYCKVQGDPLMSFLHSADVSGIDWMVRHGRSLALSVAVNVAPSRLCAGRYSSEVQDMILSNAVADRVRLWGSRTRLPFPSPNCTAVSLLTWHRGWGRGSTDWAVRPGFKFCLCQ